jgi:site-specific recombinase XerD
MAFVVLELPIGKNKICAWMGHLLTSAGLSKRYTDHCIRATVATGLKHKGIDLLSIKSVTGHRNEHYYFL